MSADDLDPLSEDYSVVDHRLQLFLDVEVFEEEEEELRSFLKVWKSEACEKGSCCCSWVWVCGRQQFGGAAGHGAAFTSFPRLCLSVSL